MIKKTDYKKLLFNKLMQHVVLRGFSDGKVHAYESEGRRFEPTMSRTLYAL